MSVARRDNTERVCVYFSILSKCEMKSEASFSFFTLTLSLSLSATKLILFSFHSMFYLPYDFPLPRSISKRE